MSKEMFEKAAVLKQTLSIQELESILIKEDLRPEELLLNEILLAVAAKQLGEEE